MKKNKLFIITTMILSAFVFTGCFDPIYYTIRKDVKPEKATVSGDITSIARYKAGSKEFLVLAADAGLRYKETGDNTHGNWHIYNNLPFSTVYHDFDTNSYKGQRIMKVLADQNYLYVATIQYESESAVPHSPKLWAAQINENWDTPSEAWKEITSKDFKLPMGYDGRKAKAYFNIFYTNDIKPENRKAFLRIGHSDSSDDKYKVPQYYVLQGTAAPKLIPTPVSADPAHDDSNNCINSAVYFNGGIKFFNSPVSITNGTATKDATYIYYGDDSDLYYSNNGTSFTKAIDVDAHIGSLAVCSDAILFGCGNPNSGSAGGIRKTTLTDGVPGSSLKEFSTNAEFQLPAAYTIMAMLNENPDKKELDSALYATVTFPGIPTSGNSKNEDKGLWSYYPERGNWNRE